MTPFNSTFLPKRLSARSKAGKSAFITILGPFVCKSGLAWHSITLTKRVAFDLFGRVIEKTPVDTGRARASWNIAIGAPDLRVMPEGKYTGEQLKTLKAATVLATYGIDARKHLPPIYISNNLPYIQELEHGSSQQAPQGMLALSLKEVTNNLNTLSRA